MKKIRIGVIGVARGSSMIDYCLAAGNAQLAKYDAAYLGDTTQKVLYLTFDAGYENGNTAKILDILKKHNAPAAFFLVGHYIE